MTKSHYKKAPIQPSKSGYTAVANRISRETIFDYVLHNRSIFKGVISEFERCVFINLVGQNMSRDDFDFFIQSNKIFKDTSLNVNGVLRHIASETIRKSILRITSVVVAWINCKLNSESIPILFVNKGSFQELLHVYTPDKSYQVGDLDYYLKVDIDPSELSISTFDFEIMKQIICKHLYDFLSDILQTLLNDDSLVNKMVMYISHRLSHMQVPVQISSDDIHKIVREIINKQEPSSTVKRTAEEIPPSFTELQHLRTGLPLTCIRPYVRDRWPSLFTLIDKDSYVRESAKVHSAMYIINFVHPSPTFKLDGSMFKQNMETMIEIDINIFRTIDLMDDKVLDFQHKEVILEKGLHVEIDSIPCLFISVKANFIIVEDLKHVLLYDYLYKESFARIIGDDSTSTEETFKKSNPIYLRYKEGAPSYIKKFLKRMKLYYIVLCVLFKHKKKKSKDPRSVFTSKQTFEGWIYSIISSSTKVRYHPLEMMYMNTVHNIPMDSSQKLIPLSIVDTKFISTDSERQMFERKLQRLYDEYVIDAEESELTRDRLTSAFS